MFKIKLISSFALLLISSVSIAFAQEALRPKAPTVINGGIINGKAKSLPPPTYPEAAKAVHAGGAVNVRVLIDENGDVVSAEATSGNPLLRAAAVEAARASKFTPTLLSGQPVKVNGVIVYNFVSAPENKEDKVGILGLSAFLFMLRGSSDDLESLKSIMELKELIPNGVLTNVPKELQDVVKEVELLKSLEKTPKEKRKELIDRVVSGIEKKLPPKDIWQFELGKNFGDFFAQLFKVGKDGKFDFSNLDESAIKLDLAKIKDLTYSAPPDFPVDVLEKFKQFSDVNDKENLFTQANLEKLITKMMAVVNTISPEPVK
jgi:TonB family protein